MGGLGVGRFGGWKVWGLGGLGVGRFESWDPELVWEPPSTVKVLFRSKVACFMSDSEVDVDKF